jgi:hypothetical protein
MGRSIALTFWPCFYTAISVAIVFNVQGTYSQAGAFLVILPAKIVLSHLIRKAVRRDYAREIEERLSH